MAKEIVPLGDRVLVKRIDEVETEKGGIILPDQSVEQPQEGEVVGVGQGSIHPMTGEIIPMNLAVGNMVLLPKYGPTEIQVDGEPRVICKEDDILALIREKI